MAYDRDLADRPPEYDKVAVVEMNGREMSGWLRVDVDGQVPVAELRQWIDLGIGYARSLPPR